MFGGKARLALRRLLMRAILMERQIRNFAVLIAAKRYPRVHDFQEELVRGRCENLKARLIGRLRERMGALRRYRNAELECHFIVARIRCKLLRI